MTALDKAFIKAYAPTRRLNPSSAVDAFAQPQVATAATPHMVAAEKPPVLPSALPELATTYEPMPAVVTPDALTSDVPPVATLAANDASPIAVPSQVRRRVCAIGHAPSPVPAPHAIFSGPARRHTFKPSVGTIATETPSPNVGTHEIPTRNKGPMAEAEITQPAVKAVKTAKAAKGQPSEQRQPAKVEPPKPAAAKPALSARKSNAMTPASTPAARPNRKTPKSKIQTAERDELLDNMAAAIGISSSADQRASAADKQPAAVAASLMSTESALEHLPLTTTLASPPAPQTAGMESAVAPVEAPNPQELPANELENKLADELAASSQSDAAATNSLPDGAKEPVANPQAATSQTDTAPTDSPIAPPGSMAEPSAVAAPPTAADISAAEPLASASAKAGARTERRPLSDFVRQLPVEDAFHPHLEVDYFLWPTAVDALVARSGPALGNFATQLTAQASAGEKVLALSGGGRGEGRTSVMLAVARQIAQRGGRVVIVDADFEKPDLARYVGLAPVFGWDDVLQGELSLEEVLITSLRDRVAIVPWHQRLPPGVLPFHPLRASISLGMLRDHYDLVLVDGGPLLADRKPNGLASLVQAVAFRRQLRDQRLPAASRRHSHRAAAHGAT